MREELLELAGAGCAVIQMEEPNIHLVGDPARRRRPQLGVDFFVEVFNNTVKGLRDLTEVWGHTPAGAIRRSSASSPPTSCTQDALPYLNQLDVDVLTFECATSDGMDLEVDRTVITDKKIAIGVVDHRNLQVEAVGHDLPQRLLRVDAAAALVDVGDLDRLADLTSPSSGFSSPMSILNSVVLPTPLGPITPDDPVARQREATGRR